MDHPRNHLIIAFTELYIGKGLLSQNMNYYFVYIKGDSLHHGGSGLFVLMVEIWRRC